jgi:hypothetical protein
MGDITEEINLSKSLTRLVSSLSIELHFIYCYEYVTSCFSHATTVYGVIV